MITIMEVGPRDGLQNSKIILDKDQKISLIDYLISCGLTEIEGGSFVRADRVPAMAHSDEIAQHYSNKKTPQPWFLVPNLKGLETALATGANRLAFFTATSNTFNQKNIGMTVEASIKNIKDCLDVLKKKQTEQKTEKKIDLRLYISTVIACPYEGEIKPEATFNLIEQLLPLGFTQISLGDTIGVGTPKKWKQLLGTLQKSDPSLFEKNRLAMHCHDTYSTALTCVATGLEQGITTFDASIGGLGGCPYAKGASGNLATEDLVYFLEQEGLKTGIDLQKLLHTFEPTRTGTLTNLAKVAHALRAKA